MNIIPFVTIFLLIFALLSGQFVNRTRHTAYEQILYSGYLEAERQVRTMTEIAAFETHKKNNKNSPQARAEKKPKRERASQGKEEAYTSHRVPGTPLATLNIYPLFEENAPPELYELAKSYWKEIYLHLYDEKTLDALFEEMLVSGRKAIAKAKKENQTIALTFKELYPKNKPECYYRLLKGTRRFDISAKSGIPPIEQFFSLLPKYPRQKLFSFSCASPSLLSLALGAPLTDAILEKERAIYEEERKKRSLSPQELQELAAQYPALQDRFQKLLPLMSFERQTKNSGESLTAQSEKSGITATKKVV